MKIMKTSLKIFLFKARAIKFILGFLFVLNVLTGCNRFLDEKSDTTLAVPMTLEDN